MNVLIAFLDLVPTITFIWATIILQRDLYHMMPRLSYTLFSTGNMMIIAAGVYKCTWKILMYLEICDFVVMNTSFFLMQSTGFLLSGIGMILMFRKQKGTALLAAAGVPLYTSSLIFVIFNVVGLICVRIGLACVAKKMGRKAAMAALICSIPVMMGMGFLSSRDFSQPIYNLYAELVNMLGQVLLLVAVYDMHREGLGTFELGGDENA
ncbi:MAG: hypothetical protein U0L49_03735 [Eubacterium sp.]|nr:hypothetical protein [Eubacterium sp.]